MAFWKKSEDPWDIAPEKRRQEAERKDGPGLLDEIKNWNETRKAEKKAQREREENLPAECCPWCGKEMERGYLDAVKGGDIWWLAEKPGFKNDLLGPDPKTSLLVTNEGGIVYTYKTAWYCGNCKRMVLDATDLTRPYDTGTAFQPEETEKSEGSEKPGENHDL